ncbi:TetR/AcrR family transcriptional regulator [Miniphocaeibacter massiliensis]|uniref:TetR/AcrR family transcriptional regulator n=1 Tax=Miniphocaeibacter massiliensis TaxID=2041841 RepID=UPI000C06EBF7|nr:TetR/AcrR family transcriptional regulator [Miniphocaeibacter massiliensis]
MDINSISESNKVIQKKRMINYFIDAAKKIIQEESIQNITIRKVAMLAGYNSATLYKYFDDLNHLKFFSAMTYLNVYIDDIPLYVKGVDNSKDIYLRIWDCYIDHSFKMPNIYYYLFFADLKKTMEQYTEEYYSIFPLNIKIDDEIIKNMLLSYSLNTRSKILMDSCVKNGIIKKEEAYMADDIIICIYESYLLKVQKKLISQKEATIKVKEYIREVFNKFS